MTYQVDFRNSETDEHITTMQISAKSKAGAAAIGKAKARRLAKEHGAVEVFIDGGYSTRVPNPKNEEKCKKSGKPELKQVATALGVDTEEISRDYSREIFPKTPPAVTTPLDWNDDDEAEECPSHESELIEIGRFATMLLSTLSSLITCGLKSANDKKEKEAK